MAEATITDWVEKAFRLISIYLRNLFRLIAGPKRFIAERLASQKSPVENALAFLAVSVFIGWLLELQWMQYASMLDLARDGAFFLIWTIVFGGAYTWRGIWWGGEPTSTNSWLSPFTTPACST